MLCVLNFASCKPDECQDRVSLVSHELCMFDQAAGVLGSAQCRVTADFKQVLGRFPGRVCVHEEPLFDKQGSYVCGKDMNAEGACIKGHSTNKKGPYGFICCFVGVSSVDNFVFRRIFLTRMCHWLFKDCFMTVIVPLNSIFHTHVFAR